MLLRGLGFQADVQAPRQSQPLQSKTFDLSTPATKELQRRLAAAGVTGEQAARDWLEQQTGIPFNGLDDSTARAYLAALNARAASANAPPPPPASGISMTTVAIGGAVALGAAFLFLRRG